MKAHTVPEGAGPTPTAPTLRLASRLFVYRPGLFALNWLLWGLLHASPALLTYAVSRLFGQLEGGALAAAWGTLALFAAVRLGRFGVFYGAFRAWIELWYTLDALVRRNLLGYLLTAPGARRLGDTPAEAVSRFRDDVDDVAGYTEVWVDGAGFFVYSAVALTLMARVDPFITLIVCAPLFLMIALVQRLSPTIRSYRRQMREATARVTDFIGETFGAVSAVKLAAREEGMVAHLRALGETRRRAALRDVLLTEVLRGVNTNLVNLAVGLVLLLGAGRVRGEALSVGDFVLFIGLLPRLTASLGFFGDAIARHRRTGVSFERMNRLLVDAPPLEAVEHRPVYLHADPPPLLPPAPAEALEELRVEGLSAHYGNPAAPALRNVSFGLRRGAFVVVTGRVGSGKTTLLRALLGLLPRSGGEVYWNGERVADPASTLVPPRSAYAAQLPNLFSQSLGENVLSGADPAGLERALRLARLEADLDGLAAGLDTPVGARGVKLSGGQLQRAAVARMLARPADLLVFDDVSSALDARTEAELWEGLGQLDATCLVVSHRRAALARADHILVMSGGQLCAQGRLDDLLAQSPELRALWESEAEGDGTQEAGAEDRAEGVSGRADPPSSA